MTSSTLTRVINLTKAGASNESRPKHWLDDKASAFYNPWPSWRYHGISDLFRLPWEFIAHTPRVPKDLDQKLPIRTPIWGTPENRDKIQATWLGHSCFFLEFPAPKAASRGARVLFDPVFSDRCSPSQWIGPKRYTRTPCSIEQIPEVDAVVISHNHYDHMDTHTLQTLLKRDPLPHFFAPLGNQAYFDSLRAPPDHAHILDWWESRRVEIELTRAGPELSPATPKTTVALDLTCTPSQHFTGRGIRDRFKSLWASWAVQAVSDLSLQPHQGDGVKVWFGGDTGYRTVYPGKTSDDLAHCPAFKEIGERFGGFDFAMIPIGAYMPRYYMSPIHCSPEDSVHVFQDIRANRALGMHWGTWILTTEDIMDPPKHLAQECEKVGIQKGLFEVCDIGETVAI